MIQKIARFLSDLAAPFQLPAVQKNGWNNRVLIIKDDALGDFLLFSGVLRYLISFWNQKQIYLAVNKRIAPVAGLYLPEDQIIPIDFKQYESSAAYRLSVLKNLRSIGFEMVVASIHRSSVCNHLVKHLGADIRYGYEKELIFKNRRFGLYNKQILSFDHLQQTTEQYNHVLDHERHFASQIIGKELTLDDVQPFIEAPPVSPSIPASRYFVVLPEAGDMKRVFPHNATINLISKLCHDYAIKAVVIGTGHGYDAAVFDGPNTVNLLGKTSLTEALSIIKKACFTLGNETGLAHASWIMETPTVMIYGGGHYGRFLPTGSGNNEVVIHRMDCFCCHWNCTYPDAIVPCISRIPEASILKAVKDITEHQK